MSHHTYSRITTPPYRASRSRVALHRLAKRFDAAAADGMPKDLFTALSTTVVPNNSKKKEA